MESNDVIPMTPKSRTKFGPNDNLADFFEIDSLYAPPAKRNGHGGELLMKNIKMEADNILRPSGEEWEGLTKLQQVKLSFLIARDQINLLTAYYLTTLQDEPWNVAKIVADVVLEALDDTTDTGRCLEVFVRKGGDIEIKSLDDATDPYNDFLDKHPEWRYEESAFTLFNQFDGKCWLHPLYRYQLQSSSLCYMIASANMLFHRFYKDCICMGKSHEEACRQLTFNVSRFMRNRFSNDQIFQNIFRGQGGDPTEILDTLLRPFVDKTFSDSCTRELPLDYFYGPSDVGKCFGFLVQVLKTDGPLLIGCRSIPAVTEPNDRLLVDDLCIPEAFDSLDKHAMLIMGARLTNSPNMGGIELLVQNTYSYKPFFVLGVSVLYKLEVEKFFAIPSDLHFDAGKDCHDNPQARRLFSGNHSALTDNSISRRLDFAYEPVGVSATRNRYNDRQNLLSCFDRNDPSVRVNLFPTAIPNKKAANGTTRVGNKIASSTS